MNDILILCLSIGLPIIFIAIVLISCYIQAPPNIAYILSGVTKSPRIFNGSGGFKIPFFERKDELYLGQISVDIVTSEPVPTNDFINVNIDGIAKVRVSPNSEGIQLAAKNFLNMSPEDIAEQLESTLQGNMREIVGTLDLKSLNTDRENFSKKVFDSAVPDMKKLGIEILSFNIQNINDNEGLIADLGADNTAAIQKNAKMTKINADKEVAICDAKAKEEANKTRVDAELSISEQNNNLAIKQAELKVKEDINKAKADAAYKIQEQEQKKLINAKSVEADIEKTKYEQKLSEEKIKVKENELIAEVNKQAEADKYKTEIDAAAELELKKRKAEAETYEAEQKAQALKYAADADKYRIEQEAAAIKARAEADAYNIEQKGLAEAKAIEQKGLAEAKAMELKAEAFSKYGNAAIIEMMVNVLPSIAENVARPISSVSNMSIYGGDMSTVSNNVPVVMKQVMDVMKDVTGVDMKDVIKSNTIDAKVNKNFKIDMTETTD